jgi:hypothetical protein
VDHPSHHLRSSYLALQTDSWSCCCRDEWVELDVALVDNHCRDHESHNDKTHQLDSVGYAVNASYRKYLEVHLLLENAVKKLN